jgi:large subunit ribosomal protein L18
MASGATFTVAYRRKRKQKTDYKRRLNLLKSGTIRFVVRPSNKHMSTQLVEYHEDGDKVLASAHTSELKTFGWQYSNSNTPSAYLVGLLCGKRGKEKGIEKAILDLGLFPKVKGCKIYSALKGLQDSGVESPASEEIFPSEERISGKTIASYFEDKKNIESDFKKAKEKILSSK